MSARIVSGTVEGPDNIKFKTRKAIKEALEIAITDGISNASKSVAQRTGAMRAGVLSTGSGSDKRKIIVKALTRGNDVVIRGEDILNAMIDNEFKIKYHTRQSSQFNPAFAAGYRKPTTPNTKPIDVNEVILNITTRLRAALPKQLRLNGLEVR